MTARVSTDVDEAARRLIEGQLVAIPTETVYGLAANALDPAACLRIFEVKERPAFDPLIVHVAGVDRLDALVAEVPAAARALVEAFWPGPLTLVLPKRRAVPDIVTSGLDTVAVRLPAHPTARALLERLRFPLAAPSANLFGRVSPTTPDHVVEQLGGRIGMVLDGGACEVGVESTIIGWEGDRCVVYRPGGVPLEAIEAVVGPLGTAQQRAAPASPGMLEAHYAPRTGLVLGDPALLLRQFAGKRIGLLAFREARPAHRCVVLAPDGDLRGAARRLFGALRELDACGADLIVAERVPEIGLGRAINDRLGRAAAARRNDRPASPRNGSPRERSGTSAERSGTPDERRE